MSHLNEGPFLQPWDYEARVPIVDGKIHDPVTGEIKPKGEWLMSGPPAMDLVWTNIKTVEVENLFTTCRITRAGPLDKILISIGKFLEKGLCEIHTISASAYSVTCVIYTEVTTNEFVDALGASELF